ncbi:MAG: type 4a pilus biogenesis protein PilO [Terriglobales bacterium]
MTQSGALRRKLRTATASFLAADVLLLVFLLSPWGPSRTQAEGSLARAEGRYVTLDAQVTGLRRLSQEVHASQRQARQLLASGMPPERTAEFRLLRSLQGMAQNTGVVADAFGFHPGRKVRLGLRQLTIAMRVTGPYASVVRFINHVERAPLFLIVRQVSLSARSNRPGALALAIQMESYVQAQDAAPQTPPAPEGAATEGAE